MIVVKAYPSKKHDDVEELTITIDGITAGFAYAKNLKGSAFIYYVRNTLELLEKELEK